MNIVSKITHTLANSGIERTPSQVNKIILSICDLHRTVNIEIYRTIYNMTLNEFSNTTCNDEITMVEVYDLRDIILHVCEMKFPGAKEDGSLRPLS